jgi:alanine racemase
VSGQSNIAGSKSLGSQALLTIDLNAFVANWRAMSARAAPAQCAAVVKADAYGIGLEPAALALSRAGCTSFFVAHITEALSLRAILGAAPAQIYCLNGLPDDAAAIKALLSADIIPVIGSASEWALWQAQAPKRKAALHIDTGMNRLGMSADEAAAIVATREATNIAVVMSHFASSEERDNPLNAAQHAAFDAVRQLFPDAVASLSNSSGVFLPSSPHYDLVRVGYGLYGGNPTPGAPNPMQSVVRLQAPIIQLREVEAGAPVGYNSIWRAPTARHLATIGVGYADGLLRSASGSQEKTGAQGYLGGVLCPIVGRVSMDLSVIDVTDAPVDAAQPGAMVELLGANITIDDLAARANTIGYEILTSLSRRYHRVYVGG